MSTVGRDCAEIAFYEQDSIFCVRNLRTFRQEIYPRGPPGVKIFTPFFALVGQSAPRLGSERRSAIITMLRIHTYQGRMKRLESASRQFCIHDGNIRN